MPRSADRIKAALQLFRGSQRQNLDKFLDTLEAILAYPEAMKHDTPLPKYSRVMGDMEVMGLGEGTVFNAPPFPTTTQPLEVACPYCAADAGEGCLNSAGGFHIARLRIAGLWPIYCDSDRKVVSSAGLDTAIIVKTGEG